jgi:hypothetical protein
MSAYSNRRDSVNRAGIEAFLQKPFGSVQLIDTMRTLLR